MQSLFKQHILPHLGIIVFFYAIIAIYFSGAVFDGKVMKQGDALTWNGNAKEIYDHRAKYGEEPLWTNALFGGMPAYTISVIFSGELLEHVEKAISLGLPYPVSILFMSLLCFYLTMLAFGVRPPTAALAAIAFTFFTFNFVSIEAGHNSKVRAMVLAPLVLGGMHLAFRGKYLLGFIMAAFGAAMQVRAGHYQISYYLGFAVLFFGISEFIFALKEKRITSFAIAVVILLLAGGLGLATNAGRLLTLKEYTQYSMRGKPELKPKDENKPKDGGLDRDYVFSWSNGKMETFTLLIPGFYGGSSSEATQKNSNVAKALRNANASVRDFPQSPTYWGDQPFTSGPVYAGAIVMFLFILGFFVLENRYKYWLGGVAFFSIMLTWGRNFEVLNFAMYDYFPSYNQFRSVTMAIFIAQMAMPIMGALALDKILHTEFTPELRKKLFIAGGITGGICLLFAILPGLAGDFTSPNDARMKLPDWLMDAIIDDRKDMLQGDAFRSFVFVAVAFALIYIYLIGKVKLNAMMLVGIIMVLTLADLWLVDKRYLNKENFVKKNDIQREFEPTEADNLILTDKAPNYRVLNLNNPFNESRTSYLHKSIGGYSPVKVRRYQDLIENDLTQEIEFVISKLREGATSLDFLAETRILNMLNTRYIKASEEARGVIRNPYAMGNAWFVNEVMEVKSPDEEIEATRNFNPKTTAIIDKNKFKTSKNSYELDSTARISLVEYRSNYLKYSSENNNAGLAVFSEIFYPEGWEIKIDGNVVSAEQALRANYVLRALEIPAGNHTIEFHFKPDSFFIGNTISLYASILLLGLTFFVVVLQVKGLKKNGEGV
jgi:hypothetical protein